MNLKLNSNLQPKPVLPFPRLTCFKYLDAIIIIHSTALPETMTSLRSIASKRIASIFTASPLDWWYFQYWSLNKKLFWGNDPILKHSYYVDAPYLCTSLYDLQTSGTGKAWELVRNADSEVSPDSTDSELHSGEGDLRTCLTGISRCLFMLTLRTSRLPCSLCSEKASLRRSVSFLSSSPETLVSMESSTWRWLASRISAYNHAWSVYTFRRQAGKLKWRIGIKRTF